MLRLAMAQLLGNLHDGLMVDDRRNPFSGRAWDVTFALASQPQQLFTNATLSEVTGLSRSFVSRVCSGLGDMTKVQVEPGRWRATDDLITTAGSHWPQPVAYLQETDTSVVQDTLPIGGSAAEAALNIESQPGKLNLYVTSRKHAIASVAAVNGIFVSEPASGVTIRILNSRLLPHGPLPDWAYAIELCATSRGREEWREKRIAALQPFQRTLAASDD
jgi:hypothetical protein